MSDLYEKRFYDGISSGSIRSARVVLPLLLNSYPANSIVDIGCGNGAWLSVMRELGRTDIVGVDGPWAAGSKLIPDDRFIVCDLSESWPTLDRRFDLAISTEVAEHLPPERGPQLVALLTGLADVVLFSAAIPRQGGTGHRNERWQSYWAELFRRQGYGVRDVVRPKVWTNDDVEVWYRQNLLVYEKNATEDCAMLDVVHPLMWSQISRQRGRAERFARTQARRARSKLRQIKARRTAGQADGA